MPEPAQPAAIPPQAITAAAQAVHDWDHRKPGKCTGVPLDAHVALAKAALEAAAPHLAAFPCCPTACDDDCEQPCHEVHDIPSHRDHNPETCVATIVSAAAAAGRERVAQLAGSLKFTLWRPAANGPGGDTQALDVVPLGELLAALREGGDGG